MKVIKIDKVSDLNSEIVVSELVRGLKPLRMEIQGFVVDFFMSQIRISFDREKICLNKEFLNDLNARIISDNSYGAVADGRFATFGMIDVMFNPAMLHCNEDCILKTLEMIVDLMTAK